VNRLSLRAIASRLEQGEYETVVKELMELKPSMRPERLLPLAWLSLRAWSAILNVFGANAPPSTERLSRLEVLLTQLAVEARVIALRGIVDEVHARELSTLLIDDKLVSLLRSCRAGQCNPRAVVKYAELFRLLGEVLALAAGGVRDCIPA